MSEDRQQSDKPTWRVQPLARKRARELRSNSTIAERLVWASLRAHRLQGASFRRQTPIGPYIADFVCHDARLIVEIDGGQHFEGDQLKRDARRDAFLKSKGFKILRFANNDVMANRNGVLEVIVNALNAPPP